MSTNRKQALKRVKKPTTGRNASATGVKHSANKAKHLTVTPELRRALAASFAHWQTIRDSALRKEYREEFLFHMTDWIGDLEQLSNLFDRPNQFTKKQTAQIIFNLFFHALAHIKAAGRILFAGEMRDPFANLYKAKNLPDQKGPNHGSEDANG